MTTTSPEVSRRHRIPDCDRAVQFDLNRNATLETRCYLGGDRGGIFRTRIVAGNPDAVGTRLRCSRHQRTLPAITITAAAENADDTTGGMALHTGQNFHERIGRVGEIDHDQGMPGRSNELHATRRGR